MLQPTLERLTLFFALLLLLIWPIEGTIAARNIALIFGSLTGLSWVILYGSRRALSMFLPQLCLIMVPLWLWAHYILLPGDKSAQLYDLEGTWLRVIFAIIMAASLGLILSDHTKYQRWLWLPMIALVIASLGMFLNEAMIAEQLLVPGFRAMFKYKSAVVYFLMWPCILAYVLLYFRIMHMHENKPSKWFSTVSIFALLGSCWFLFIAAQALNGVLIAAFIGAIFLIIFLIDLITNRNINNSRKWLLFLTFFSIFAVSVTAFWSYDKNYEKKLVNLILDVQTSVQIDKYNAWQKNLDLFQPYPTNEAGRTVNGSTYERAAWFVKGSRLLIEHPEGAGFSHGAFRYFMHQENPRFDVHKTHSGWLDFALGVGVPGIVLTWLAIALVVGRAVRNCSAKNDMQKRKTATITLAMLSGIWLLWWPVEVSEREFIEHFYFMIAFFAAINCQVMKKTF